MNASLLNIQLATEPDVVVVRQRAKQIAALLGLTSAQQTALATSVSEIARNAINYGASPAGVEYTVQDKANSSMLSIVITDKGQGIAELQKILDGGYQSRTGMGLGIIGSRRLCDEFYIESGRDGTTVRLSFNLPKPVTAAKIASLSNDLIAQNRQTPLQEMREQNRELLATLQSLSARQAEVERLNSELSETNRGVLALYAELDEQANSLRRMSDSKSRFLSDMTHELRTPLNAMISLGRLLLDRTDGELTAEQEKQVKLIHHSATGLGEMVNDLLDLAKIEAGKIDVHAEPFSVSDVLATLRGMFRPLFASTKLHLVIDDALEGLTMISDEQKVSQILRNLVSNAMKFSEAGDVRIVTELNSEDQVVFTVTDSGIGIAAQNLASIFDEYGQIDGPLQRRQKGTGLGLPLTRRLCRLLGGDVSVTSEPGRGSRFVVHLPRESAVSSPVANATLISLDQSSPDPVSA